MTPVKAVTIHDLHRTGRAGVLAVDLIDVLRLNEPAVAVSSWRCGRVECMGETAEELHGVSDSGAEIGGAELLRLAAGVHQVIDGDFAGTRQREGCPWLIVRAIDSTLYVVIASAPQFLARVRERFTEVRDAPEEANPAR